MKVLFVSLGCDKNRVDTEVMLGGLKARGYTFTDDEEQAEAVVVNTCCFIDAAKEESIAEILSFAERRKNGSLKALIVTGCLAERYREEILREMPEVDAILGVTATDRIAEVISRVVTGEAAADEEAGESHRIVLGKPDAPVPGGLGRVLTTGGSYEFLRIAEGCDKHCTYCVIPSIRGRYRSAPMEELIDEARMLAAAGVRELILVAQETTRYGIDRYGEKRLPMLLRRLCQIEELHWIRVLYCYPEEIDDELIEVIAGEQKICKYIDIPIQSGSDRILRRMGRRVDRAAIISLVRKLRARIPDICIRTTLIAGFPGETAEDHNASMELIRELCFDRLGVFVYSQEEGTPAAAMPDQVPERLKKTRRTKLMKLQREINREACQAMIGRIVEAVIEGRVVDEDGDSGDVYAARTWKDVPEVDGALFIEHVDPDRELLTGSFVQVRVTGAADYDLTGVLIDENESSE